MTRKERIMKTLKGETVDRPAYNFYEINGHTQDTENDDPFNIYNDSSWWPLIKLARERSDRIVNGSVGFKNGDPDPYADLMKTETYYDENGSRFVRTVIKAGKRELTSLTKRDPDINTVWTIEHLVKDVDDLNAWLELPSIENIGEPDITDFVKMEEEIGETGIVMINSGDPICSAAPLFEMGQFTVIALTEQQLFHRVLQKFANVYNKKTEAIAKALPGRLWRICGPEYASPPYLPPYLFKEYVYRYDKPMVETIQKYGGYARIHSHGNLKDILDFIVDTGCMGLDPIEPPGQGDVTLEYVRKKYGDKIVLFGNIEASDIENLPTEKFKEKVEAALREGTAGEGRGFVLQPSACPYGRKLSQLSLKNYEIMADLAESFQFN